MSLGKLAVVKKRPLRVLDFDCECRPLAWYGGDWVTKQPTAIAWCFIGEDTPTEVAYIGESHEPDNVIAEERAMMERFRLAYDAADIVTGHYIRGFDLPLLTGALMRLGGVPLASKLTTDTKQDLYRGSGLSKSQENLGAMFELDHPKVPMNTAKWMEGNMLTTKGISETINRVVGDVEQHMELRAEMIRRGVLGQPVWWTAEPGRSSGGYAP